MNWKTLEGFEEKLAKVSFKAHKTFDGKVVEVLYGAKDENGNFVSAADVWNAKKLEELFNRLNPNRKLRLEREKLKEDQ